MKFAMDQLDGGYVINAYQPGRIVINQAPYEESLLLMPERIMPGWDIKDVESLNIRALLQLAEYKPEIVILGTGATQVFPETKLFVPLMDMNIGYEVMDTAAACRTYNILLAEGRRVLAALLV